MSRLLVKISKNLLEIPLLNSKFHAIWLRDNCLCPNCLHSSNLQKLHSSGEITAHLSTIKSAKLLSDDSLEVEWQTGHASPSRYPLKWLKRHDYVKKSEPLIKPILWKNIEPVKVDYKDFLTSSGFKTVLTQIRDRGLAFIQNVPTDNERQVEEIAERFGDSFYGRSWDVKNDPQSKNIAYTALKLGLHMDLLYFESPPGLQLLHCLKNTVSGGTSIFNDIFWSVNQLKTLHPSHYNILTKVPVSFHYHNDGRSFEYSRPTIAEDFMNDGLRVFYAPPFQAPLRAAPDQIEAFYESFAIFESILGAPENQYRHLLKPGEVVLFSNRRVLHGREMFEAGSGDRWLKGTYVGWDEVKDRIRMTSV